MDEPNSHQNLLKERLDQLDAVPSFVRNHHLIQVPPKRFEHHAEMPLRHE